MFRHCVLFIMSMLVFRLAAHAGPPPARRGVDFRMQIQQGRLQYTGISGIEKNYSGFGAELAAHLYLKDISSLRSTLFFATRLTNYTGQDLLVGERDDLQTFTAAPGIEVHWGPLYVQGAYHLFNVNSYSISTVSKDKAFSFAAPCFSTGLNFRLGHLGVGFGASWVKTNIPAETLGLSSGVPSAFDDFTYSMNLIYYIGVPPAKFFKDLF